MRLCARYCQSADPRIPRTNRAFHTDNTGANGVMVVRGVMLVILITLGEWSEDGDGGDACYTENIGRME